jgi:hypothetical protein
LWADEERGRCVTCGTHEWEWERYDADLWRCEKCADLEWKVNDIVDGDNKGYRPVLFRSESVIPSRFGSVSGG